MTPLAEFVERYIASRDISDGYSDQLRNLVRSFEASIGQTVYTESLTPELANRHLKATRERMTPETRKSHRKMLLTLWQAAADAGLTGEPPRRKVMPIRVPDKLQRAWDVEQVRMLLAAAERLRRYYPHGIERRAYWRSYIMAAWDSGLRGCDMRLVPREAIGDDGRCVLVQHKTGKIRKVHFRPETMAAINETFPPNRETVWPLWGRLEQWRRDAKKLVILAGLKGSIGLLRHSSGTAVEVQCPGRGHEHLGNTRAVFEKHYLDKGKVADVVVLPEKL
jgi:integrase